MIELIEGDWKPHIALTLTEGKMDDLWEKFATKAEVILEFKKAGNLEIFYLRDPSGNFVEIVKEKEIMVHIPDWHAWEKKHTNYYK